LSIRIYNNLEERIRILPNGNVGIGSMGPSSLLDVAGDINFSGNLLQNGSLVDLGDNTLFNTTGDASTTSYLNYDFDTGNMGIGFAPDANLIKLKVNGEILTASDFSIAGNIKHYSSYDNFIIRTTSAGISFEPDHVNTAPAMQISPAGNVGMGLEPDEGLIKLKVNGEILTASDISVAGNIKHYSDTPSFTIRTAFAPISFEPDYANTEPAMTIALDGDVGIGFTDPAYKLDVDGTIRGDNVSASDIRWKKNIDPIEGSLEKVKQLQGVHYDWKDENKDQSRQIGFIAQDVEKIFPELVKTDDKGYKSMNYSKVVTVLVESVKELDDENRELEDRIVKLENMVETLLNEESSDKD
jgi:hypothetical protein